MSADTVTLPSGQVMTLGRARALGLVDAHGILNGNPEPGSAAALVLQQDARRITWAQTQGLEAENAALAAEVERLRLAQGGEPQITDDGLPVTGVALTRGQKAAATRAANAAAKADIEPLRPRNVDKTGAEVTDPEVLAKIAADVAALEVAKASGIALIEAGPGGESGLEPDSIAGGD